MVLVGEESKVSEGVFGLREDGDGGGRGGEPEEFVGGWVAFEEGGWEEEEGGLVVRIGL